MTACVEFVDWGTIDYAEALEKQRELFQGLIGEKSNYELRITKRASPMRGSPTEARRSAEGWRGKAEGGNYELRITNYGECPEPEQNKGSFRQSGDYTTLGEKNGEGVYSCVNDRAIFEIAEAESPLSLKPAGWLILCEHPHVYTLGRSGKDENLLVSEAALKERGAALYRTERGGDITYHGPGQIVGYPILDLERLGLGLREYIGALEQAVIETVAAFGIEAGCSPGKTGVWVNSKLRITKRASPMRGSPTEARRSAEGWRGKAEGGNYELRNSQPQDGAGCGIGEKRPKWEYGTDTFQLSAGSMEHEGSGSPIAPEAERRPNTTGERKICAIGVKASRGVVMHGFALNVATDLGWFEFINPCGFVGGAVTSMERELGRRIALDEVKEVLRERLMTNLGIRANAEVKVRKKKKNINI